MAAGYPPHLPPASMWHSARDRFPPFPAAGPMPFHDLLAELQVSGVTAIEYRCTPAWRIPPRRIADDMVFIILSGHGGMSVEGREQALAPGDVAHWRRGRTHSGWHDAARPFGVIAVHYVALLSGAVHLADAAGFPDRFRLGLDHPLVALAAEAAREYALRPPGWQRGVEALATRMLLEVVRSCGSELDAPASPPPPELARILPALEAMRATLAAPLSVPALARRCDLSQAQFRRVFARAVGCSPVAHLRRLRLAEACRLLRHTRGTVESIAGQVGYGEPAYFANTFRQAIGMPPGAYRSRGGV